MKTSNGLLSDKIIYDDKPRKKSGKVKKGLILSYISERDIVQAHRRERWSSSDLLLLLFNYRVCDTTSAFFISIRTKGRLLLSFSKIIGNHFIFRANRKQGSL